MFVYFGKRYDVSYAGSVLVEVHCETCGCEYFYELTRIGTGAASVPYLIGTGRAERQSADDQARRDLSQRLKDEAELVPCPRCHWINEAMVAGYRLSRYRGAAKLAWSLGLVGIAVSLLSALFLSSGPAADRGAVPYMLYGGPTIALSLTAFILVMRSILRSRIRPNRDHPLAPEVPAGSPAALLRNPATEDYEPVVKPSPPPLDDEFGAGKVEVKGQGRGAWMNFQVGRNVFLPICCECLVPVKPTAEDMAARAATGQAFVPLCAECLRRWSRRKRRGALKAFAGTVAVALVAYFALKPDDAPFTILAVGAGIVMPIVGSMIADRSAAPFRMDVIDHSRGVVRLWFRNETYPHRMASEALRS